MKYSDLTRASDGEPSGPSGSVLRTTTSMYNNGPLPVNGGLSVHWSASSGLTR